MYLAGTFSSDLVKSLPGQKKRQRRTVSAFPFGRSFSIFRLIGDSGL